MSGVVDYFIYPLTAHRSVARTVRGGFEGSRCTFQESDVSPNTAALSASIQRHRLLVVACAYPGSDCCLRRLHFFVVLRDDSVDGVSGVLVEVV